MKIVRAALAVVILFNLSLLAAAGPLQGTLVRYEVARKQKELRALALENRSLLHGVAVARRPDRVLERAAAFGLDTKVVEYGAGRPQGQETAQGRKPAPPAPRR